jgi:hypothetical protein
MNLLQIWPKIEALFGVNVQVHFVVFYKINVLFRPEIQDGHRHRN